ncbi:MAG: DNA helicase II / ATP-dependent DNA helicase PcrA [Parcubacteria bacterium C7867-007]|nr:MAG: DNA helicase II / ATP-dependent DNA helicase PcrA [Parcubacteria bacterium C7867-007]
MDKTDQGMFLKAYGTLNEAQKKAVDTVEGPVLVIAGPGTGKTHILTLRIANILRLTQANPTNILVLTFTESAARTVRTRLASMIGDTAARDVFITTFHGFAEHLLQNYQDSFPQAIGKRLAGDVESTLLWREVLENEDLVALRTTKSPYFYLTDLAMLRNDLLRERISLDDYRAWARTEADRIRTDESLQYQRDSKHGAKGELKPEGQKKLDRLEKVYEAARLIEAYETLKEEREVYDFADVLRIAVDGLSEDAELRASIQEQYQYVLADEHQDANALQHALLDVLAYDEHPNIFVVGDEKQAIYRFQGADSSHFKTFTEHYPRTEVISLTTSYRSRQGILDKAHTLIQAVPSATGTHLALAGREESATISVLAAPDPLAERDQIAQLISDAIAAGTEPHEIAVIAARNSTANEFAEILTARGVPTLRAGDVLLSSRATLRGILALMRAIADPLDVSSVREALLAPWWPLALSERAELLRQNRDNELMLALESRAPNVAEALATLRAAVLTTAPLPLLSKLLIDSGARAFLLSHADHLEDITLVRKLFMHIEELVARNPNQSFADVVRTLIQANEHGLENVKTSITFAEGKVTVITAHKAKGMEFKKVFVVGMNARQWEKGGMPAKIPSPVDQSRSLEDITKLFYVAITRAKDELVFSYAAESADGRETPPSALLPSAIPSITPAYDPLPVLHASVNASKLVCELVQEFLTKDGLSPSAMNEYLESPSTFFARRVLRLHEPEAPATAIGIAVHAGIAAYLETKSEEEAEAALARCLKKSLLPRNAAYNRVVEHAQNSLASYIAHEGTLKEVVAIEKGFSVTKEIAGHSIKLQGKVDAIFSTPAGECIVDFKTSSDVHIKDEKHARQLAFYDLLLRSGGHNTTHASIVQVSPEDVTEYPIPLTDDIRTQLATTLEEVIQELWSGAWRKGEPSEYDDLLKLFT